MNPQNIGYAVIALMQELTDEMKATRAGIEKLHQDLRLAHFDSTTCGNCEGEFEFPTRLSGRATLCPYCNVSITLPN